MHPHPRLHLALRQLRIGASEGIFVALLVRLRELIWTAIGLLLIKIEKKRNTTT